MLTFEEFFKKKRIDLQQLQQAEPALFAEFSKDYPLMGEKSFDYTKKYWFNNLRHLYPLPQAPKPHKVQAEAISQMAVQGVTVAAAQNLDAGIERPKFTEDNLPELVANNVPEQDELATENLQPATEGAKPAFKPRFNMQNIKKEVVKTVSETEIQNPEPEAEIKAEPATENPQPKTEEAKPAYKPRFQMKNIPKPTTDKSAIEQEPATGNPPPKTEL